MSEYNGITLISNGVRYRVYEGKVWRYQPSLVEIVRNIAEVYVRAGRGPA